MGLIVLSWCEHQRIARFLYCISEPLRSQALEYYIVFVF